VGTPVVDEGLGRELLEQMVYEILGARFDTDTWQHLRHLIHRSSAGGYREKAKRHPAGEIRMPRAELERSIAPIVERAVVVLEDCARTADCSVELVDALCLGGSTCDLLLAKHVSDRFGREPTTPVSLTNAVALGAARLALASPTPTGEPDDARPLVNPMAAAARVHFTRGWEMPSSAVTVIRPMS
jgi:molecular chaperone DnaK (HSP70)